MYQYLMSEKQSQSKNKLIIQHKYSNHLKINNTSNQIKSVQQSKNIHNNKHFSENSTTL